MPDRESPFVSDRDASPPAVEYAVGGNGHARPEFLEMGLGRNRRWRGLVAYLLLFGVVGATLVWLFVRFTGSMRLAILLVGVMIAYMTFSGWLASGKIDRRE